MPGYIRLEGLPTAPTSSLKPAVAVGVRVRDIVVGILLMVVINVIVIARVGTDIRVIVMVIPPVVII
jgi:hypothetical protein